jgi:hypothetical protein
MLRQIDDQDTDKRYWTPNHDFSLLHGQGKRTLFQQADDTKAHADATLSNSVRVGVPDVSRGVLSDRAIDFKLIQPVL